MLQKSSLPTIAIAVCSILLFCVLGAWQLQRAEQKRALHRDFIAAASLPAQPLEDIDGQSPPFWREISTTGAFDDLTVLLDNRVRNGRQGYEVYTVFKPDHGLALLVNRGWVPAGQSRAGWPATNTPRGHRSLEGRVAPPPSTGIRLGGAVQFEVLAPGRWRTQHLDDEGLRTALGLPLRSYTVLMDANEPDGFAREWALPEAHDGKHTAYAVQWFAFAGIAFGLALRALRKQMKKGTEKP